MSLNDFKKLIYSMLTASIVGVVLAFCGIYLFTLFSGTSKMTVVRETIVEEQTIDEEEPLPFSRLSNSIIYSDTKNNEVIESVKGSLPRTSKKRITAKAYQVTNLTDNAVILQKNSEKILSLASVSKLVTAVVARKLLNQDKYIIMDSQILKTYGNEGRFRVNEKLTTSELMYPLLMVSSNDASEALANAYTFGRDSFVSEMNTWVDSIGAHNTAFKDPSGLSPENVSTVGDLAIITKWILENDPQIWDITLTKSKTIRTHTWINPTHFLNLTTFAGGKYGYTTEAGRTGIYLFKLGKQKKLFQVILLDSSSRDNDVMDLLDEAVK